jgi:uncharacterized membrane protein YbhN (UPF0104 family)
MNRSDTLTRRELDKPASRSSTWAWIKRGVGLAFLLLVVVMIVRYARNVDWDDVWASVRALPLPVIAQAAALAALSQVLYSCFDLFGRRYTGHTVPAHRTMQIAFISYAFNLNMGSTVGGIGMRLRLYCALGLGAPDVARILTLSMVTNWLGAMTLAGSFFTFAPLPLPPHWRLDSDGLQMLGVALLAVVLVYLALCGWSRRRSWTLRGHEIELPPWRMALLQLAVSAANWMTIAAVIWTLLQGRIEYTSVLSVLLLAAMAGLIVRVPAGLGVLEAVFLALLSHRVPEGQLLGALLAYRAIYYLAPLAVAALLYLMMEAHARRQRVTSSPQNVREDSQSRMTRGTAK